ncbi:MAG: ribonuclease P protein component [Cyanobacteriota bacterium ELA615]
MGLPQENRLKHRQDFQLVYAQGSQHRTIHLILRSRKSNILNDCSPRIGIVISQKVSKKAVIRNRIKRQIRSIVRPWLKEIADNWQLVIIVRPQAIECKYEHFLRELKELFEQVGLVNGN